jgi:hypothetical protein
MTDDLFAGSGSAPSISFYVRDPNTNALSPKPIGTRQGGPVTDDPSKTQQRNFDSKLPEFWPDGEPKWQVVVPVEFGDERRAFYISKDSREGSQFQAVKAVTTDRGLRVGKGGELYLTLVGFKPNEDKSKASRPLYSAEYTPANEFAGDASIVTTGVPTTPEGFTLDSLISAGWTAAQISASYPALIPVTAASPPPPAPPAPAPAAPPPPAFMATPSDRDAKIAAMSPADRALLGLDKQDA